MLDRMWRRFKSGTSMTPFRVRKSAYYITRAVGVHLPAGLLRKLRDKHLQAPAHGRRIEERVDYYNKIKARVSLDSNASDLRKLRQERKTTYFYDLYEIARYFDPRVKFSYVFGDVREVPAYPAFVKSRPIAGDNAFSVLMKLNKIRHFNFVSDPYPVEKKKNALVWRGKCGKDLSPREQFIEKFAGKPGFDVGHISKQHGQPEFQRPFMPVSEQLRYKFILSLEGIDVASNLKWIMSSNSITFSLPLKFETWFMEGTLIPGVHYVELKDDFSDVEEKMEYYSNHPREAKEIVENANRYVEQFLDPAVERKISLLVFEKYLEKTGQADKIG
jgi:hypothetical protein